MIHPRFYRITFVTFRCEVFRVLIVSLFASRSRCTKPRLLASVSALLLSLPTCKR